MLWHAQNFIAIITPQSEIDQILSDALWRLNEMVAGFDFFSIRKCTPQVTGLSISIQLIVAKWGYMKTYIRVNMGSSNGVLPDNTKPLP